MKLNLEEELNKDGILRNHNFEPYRKIKDAYETLSKFCIVHAPGTGKSYLAIQLIYDILKKENNSKFLFVVPRLKIINQIKDDINELPLDNEIRNMILNSIDFVTYDSLSTKRFEGYDMIIADEFHHIGASTYLEWFKKVENITKIFGLSATPIRELYSSNPEDISKTFFDGNVASEYDLTQAIKDGVLPVPDYHVSVIELLEECEKLAEKVGSGIADDEEIRQFSDMYSQIKKKIKEEHLMPEDVIRDNIKMDGKYMYFVSSIEDVNATIESFLAHFSKEERENIEIYVVHSGQSSAVNNYQHECFVNNRSIKDGKNTSGKLRVMVSIDMYSEGVHVPDLDGVFLGRATQSDRIFIQHLGRALDVKNDKTINPLVLDLNGNIFSLLDLFDKKEIGNNGISWGSSKKYDELLSFLLIDKKILDVVYKFRELNDKARELLDEVEKKDLEFINKVVELIKEKREAGETRQASELEIFFTGVTSEHIRNLCDWWRKNKTQIVEKAKTLAMENSAMYSEVYEYLFKRKTFEDEYKNLDVYLEFVNKIVDLIKKKRESGDNKPASEIQIAFYGVITEHIKAFSNFWIRSKTEILEKAKTLASENPEEYLEAYQYLFERKTNGDERKKLNLPLEFINKVVELIKEKRESGDNSLINKLLIVFKGKSTEHINDIGIFWKYKKIQILEVAKKLASENPEEYLEVYEYLSQRKIDDTKRKERKNVDLDLEFINKIVELIKKKRDSGDNKPASEIQIVFYGVITEHIKHLCGFWNRSKMEILEKTKTLASENPEEYLEAYEYLSQRKIDDDERTKNSKNRLNVDFDLEFINKIVELITKKRVAGDNRPVLELGITFNGVATEHMSNLSVHWNNNKTSVFERITRLFLENPEEYSEAYDVLKQRYDVLVEINLSKIKKWDAKKRTDNIKYLCDENGIDYQLNEAILCRMPYDEFCAKILFLKQNDLALCDEYGHLHEIFDVTETNLYIKYGISLEDLIRNYFRITSRYR